MVRQGPSAATSHATTPCRFPPTCRCSPSRSPALSPYPNRAIKALQGHKHRQAKEREQAGEAWHDNNLVFCHENGDPYTSDALNWRFGRMTRRAGIGHWHAHEGRHTAVSIMSLNGVPIQYISDTVGHKSTHVTETVYRHVIVPQIRGGATVMDDVFGEGDRRRRQGHRLTQGESLGLSLNNRTEVPKVAWS